MKDRSRRVCLLKLTKCEKPLKMLCDFWGENASIFLIDCASGASHAVFAIKD